MTIDLECPVLFGLSHFSFMVEALGEDAEVEGLADLNIGDFSFASVDEEDDADSVFSSLSTLEICRRCRGGSRPTRRFEGSSP